MPRLSVGIVVLGLLFPLAPLSGGVAETAPVPGPAILSPAEGQVLRSDSSVTMRVDFAGAPADFYSLYFECGSSFNDFKDYDGSGATFEKKVGLGQGPIDDCFATVTAESDEIAPSIVHFSLAAPEVRGTQLAVERKASSFGPRYDAWLIKGTLRTKAGDTLSGRKMRVETYTRGKWRWLGSEETTNRRGVATWKFGGDEGRGKYRLKFRGSDALRASSSRVFRLPGCPVC